MTRPSAPSVWRYLAFLFYAIVATAQLSDALSIPSSWNIRTQQRVSNLWRRQSSSDNKTAAAAISIAPSQYWEGVDGPWSSFPLQVGSGNVGGAQSVRLMPSTAGTAIWTVGAEGCPNNYVDNCPKSRGGLFLTNQSLSWSPASIYETGLEINLGLDSSGYVGYDTATLGWPGSGGPTDAHSIIWNLADSNWWIGVFGLNPRPTNFTTFTNPQAGFLETLYNTSVIPSLSYGYTAGAQYQLAQVLGSLTLGGYDSNRFIANNVSFDFYEDISRDLSVYLQSVTTNKGSPSKLLPDGSISTFIDSSVPEIWLPESACSAFEDAFGITYNTEYNRYIITSAQRQTLTTMNPSITFTISPNQTGGETVDITLPYKAFDKQLMFPIVENPNTSYYFPIQRAANATQYTLGRTFLQEAYLIADYERNNFSVSACNWNAEDVSNENIVNIASPDQTSNTSGLTIGEIIGVACGGAGLVAILALLLFVIRRRRKNMERRRLAESASEEKPPNTSSSNRPFISNPMGGELGGGEVHEMHVPPKRMPELYSPHNVDPNKHGYSEMEGQEYYGPGKGYAVEMHGEPVYYEMPGSDVHEMGAGRRSRMSGRWV